MPAVKITVQDAAYAYKLATGRITSNARGGNSTTLGGLYNLLRKSPSLSFIGDYSLISQAINAMNHAHIFISRDSIGRAMRKSQDFKDLPKKEKMRVMECFLNIRSGSETGSKSSRTAGKSKVDSLYLSGMSI
jgi:hypothetical protein